jgi:hypothetical protein
MAVNVSVAISGGEPRVHQGDVGPQTAEFRDGICSVGRLSDKNHICLGSYNCGQSFTKDRMVLNTQDSDGRGMCHRNVPCRMIVTLNVYHVMDVAGERVSSGPSSAAQRLSPAAIYPHDPNRGARIWL